MYQESIRELIKNRTDKHNQYWHWYQKNCISPNPKSTSKSERMEQYGYGDAPLYIQNM